MVRKRVPIPLSPDSTVEEIAAWPLLSDLNGVSIAIYFRLIAASRSRGSDNATGNTELAILNRDLIPDRERPSLSIRRALKELGAAGLVRVRHRRINGSMRAHRTIELVGA